MWTSAGFWLARNAWGRLVHTDAATGAAVEVMPARAFPFSAPRHGVLLCDRTGREVAWIANLDEVPGEIRKAIEEELAQREFVPVIQRVFKVAPRIEPSEWDVETDRGRTRFVLNSADDVRRLDEDRAMVIDAHGIRYLIPEPATLDAASRRILERYF
jgi:hypothetical protein